MGSVRAVVCAVVASAVVGAFPVHAQMPGMPDMPIHKDMRWSNTLYVLIEQLEYAPDSRERAIDLDAKAWYGGALRRVWLRAQGEAETTHGDGEVEGQLLLGRLVDPFWDAVIGVRADRSWGDSTNGRVQLAVGFMGLAPYRFELEPTLFISHRGEMSARLEAAYTLLITQKLMAEPEFEVNAALQDVPEFGVRSGINDYEFGLRLRYEFRREFAPYVGWSKSRRLGITGEDGDHASGDTHFVAGFRMWR